MNEFKRLIQEIKWLGCDLQYQDWLLTWQKSQDEIKQLLFTAQALQHLYRENISTRCFTSGLAVSLFRDQSTRTRFSFSSAADLLGLSLQDLDEKKSQVGHGETLRETANMISFLTEMVGIRDDIYLGRGHDYMIRVAEALDDGHAMGVLPRRPGIVNLQSDLDHPTQTLADLLHLERHFGSLETLQGKKIAVTWAYSPSYGKPLSVPQGLIALLPRFGMDVVLAHPPGYELAPEVLQVARENATVSGGFSQTDSLEEAFTGAHVVYPKSWAPFEVMKKRTTLFEKGDEAGLQKLEQECLAQNAGFKDWECNTKNMAATQDAEALYMHCLPADISGVSCEKGEVSSAIFEKYRTQAYRQAGYKPFIIAAMILVNRFEKGVKILEQLYKAGRPRLGF